MSGASDASRPTWKLLVLFQILGSFEVDAVARPSR